MWRTVMGDDEPIRQQLNAGEHLLWSGRPRQGIRPTFEEQAGGSIAFIAFMGVWLVMVAFSILSNLRDIEGQFEPGVLIGGVGILLVGGAILALAVSSDAVDRAHTFYGLTDTRIIQITGVRRPSIRSCPLHYLQRIDVQVRDDGSGTITFEDISYTQWDTPVILRSFDKVENVQSVYDLIHRAKEQAHGQGTEVD